MPAVWLAGYFATACAPPGAPGAAAPEEGSGLPPGREIQDALLAVLPQDWALIEQQENQAPPGHGPVEARGRKYVLLGPGPVAFQWKDASGQWHSEELARETLELWAMPGSYRPSRRRFFEHHRHVPPEQIYTSSRIRVYGLISHRIVDQERFEELLQGARSTGWSDIARKSCTWQGWTQEIAAGFAARYD